MEILQGLGFTYHIDDVSRDEPFLIPVKGKPFAVVPYTLGMNDIVQFEVRNASAKSFGRELKDEFEVLYAEAATRRRMMSISTHDRIAGRPSRVKALEDFITYAQKTAGRGVHAQGRARPLRAGEPPDAPGRRHLKAHTVEHLVLGPHQHLVRGLGLDAGATLSHPLISDRRLPGKRAVRLGACRNISTTHYISSSAS